MIPQSQALLADALVDQFGLSFDDAVLTAAKIIASLKSEGYVIREEGPHG